jgi:hypothetical protein
VKVTNDLKVMMASPSTYCVSGWLEPVHALPNVRLNIMRTADTPLGKIFIKAYVVVYIIAS